MFAGLFAGFQYISCYCLSIPGVVRIATIRISIHLMLLFIIHPNAIRNRLQNFNTSHVTVYRSSFLPPDILLHISIHLMLLFIRITIILKDFYQNFNTSHVTVYLHCICFKHIPIRISIHLMLLFIIFEI